MKNKAPSINDTFNPIILRNVLARHWYKPLVVFLLIFIAIFLYLRYTKPIYEAQAVLQVIQENKTQQILGEDAVMTNQRSLSEDVELLRSPVLFRKAVQYLSLHTFVYNDGQLLTENLFGFTPFSIITHELKDSSFCNVKVFISPSENNDFSLHYTFHNKEIRVPARLSKEIRTEQFTITINAHNPSIFHELLKREASTSPLITNRN